MRTWLHAAEVFADQQGIAPEAVQALRVFDRDGDAAWSDSFEALEADLSARIEDLAKRIERELSDVVDAEQAALFAGRFRAVHALLGRESLPEARLLGVALSQRIVGILDAGGERCALRVRAAVDYHYSRAALLRHVPPGHRPPGLDSLIAGGSWWEVAPGVTAGRLDGLTRWGPQHVGVLRCRAGSVDLDALDAWPHAGQPVSSWAAEALAVFSGGFFLYSESDPGPHSARHEPVGLLMRRGEVRRPAIFRRGALLQHEDGRILLQHVSLADHRIRLGQGSWRSPGPGVSRAQARIASGLAIVADRVVDRGEHIPVPLNGVVLTERDAPVGTRVDWRLPGVRTGLSGGPLLLVDRQVRVDLPAEDFLGTAPPQTFVGDETGDRNLLPRLGVGVTSEGELIVAAVDGRDLDRALGLPLHGLGELLRALGAVRGLNLDGGSSKRLIVDGQAIDRPSAGIQGGGRSAAPPRPLHTAVVVRRR